VEQYWKEIGRKPKVKRNMTQKKVCGEAFFSLSEKHCGGMGVLDQGILFLREVSRRSLKKVVM